MGRRFLTVLVALLLAQSFVGQAEAHAALVRSDPPAGASLQSAPAALVLEFSEALDAGFTRVQLFDSRNQIVNQGPGTIDAGEPQMLRLALGTLPDGSYTAIWRARSAVDGHVTEGSVPFGVGVEVTGNVLIPPPGAPDPATEGPPLLDSLLRWLNLLLAAVTVGGLAFGLLLWRPVLATDGRELTGADLALTRLIRRLTIVGGVLLLAIGALFMLSQAANAAGVPLGQAFGAPLAGLLGGRFGQLWLARAVLTILIMILAWRLPSVGSGPRWYSWVGLALGGLLLLTFSLSAHAAAVEQGAATAILLDWLHLVGMVAWLGGLPALLAVIVASRRDPEGWPPLALLIPRFSRVAVAAVVILTLTGIYSAILHIGRLDLVAATTYGRALGVKLGLFALLLALAALNLLILSPRLRGVADRAAQAIGRNVGAELALGALVLLAVGVMTSVAPGKTAWDLHERQGIAEQAQVDNVDLTLRVAPAQIGDNEFAVDVIDRRPGAQQAASKVLLRFEMVGMEMSQLQVEARPGDAERYTARGNYLSMGGRWQVEVILRRAGFDDVRHTFQLDVIRSAVAAN